MYVHAVVPGLFMCSFIPWVVLLFFPARIFSESILADEPNRVLFNISKNSRIYIFVNTTLMNYLKNSSLNFSHEQRCPFTFTHNVFHYFSLTISNVREIHFENSSFCTQRVLCSFFLNDSNTLHNASINFSNEIFLFLRISIIPIHPRSDALIQFSKSSKC